MKVLKTLRGVLALALPGLLVLGCDRGANSKSSGAAGSAGQVSPAGPVFIFFDGKDPLPPSKWAQVAEPSGGDGAAAIGALHMRDVNKKHADSGYFEDGVKAHPEFDPTSLFVDDLRSIVSMGEAASIAVRWTGPDSAKGFRDYLVLPDGTEGRAVGLAGYFSAMAGVARDGGLLDLERDQRLSDHLLWIGYNIYKSDSDVTTSKPRSLILGSAWNAAFELKKQYAKSLGRNEEADAWGKRDEELIEACRAIDTAARAERTKIYGDQ